MAENVIYVRGTRAEVRRAIHTALQGQGDAARTMLVRMGLTALGRIKKAFVVKARGGTDEAGLSWPPLKKTTIAYSRRHPGVLWPGAKRAPFAPSWMLTTKQRERWWDLYRRSVAWAGKSWAAARAWQALKAEGARTLLSEYGNTKVDILRSTDLLINSLSPGVDPSQAGPVPPPVENQEFRLAAGEVIIGTNRKYAAVHHEGRGHVPQRRLWPEPSRWPASWWRDIAEQGRMGLIDVLLSELRQ